jgi:hypothetical protein
MTSSKLAPAGENGVGGHDHSRDAIAAIDNDTSDRPILHKDGFDD